MNRSGGVDGLHKMGTSKKSSGITYDLCPEKKFCLWRLFSQKIYCSPGQMITMSVPARVSSTLAMA
ncbi:hypothetical protein B6J19_12090 [Klebsiella quasipneumoniae]|nr:hypothetical protein B6J19_12090 [Klebsiella quasipneumoniae]